MRRVDCRGGAVSLVVCCIFMVVSLVPLGCVANIGMVSEEREHSDIGGSIEVEGSVIGSDVEAGGGVENERSGADACSCGASFSDASEALRACLISSISEDGRYGSDSPSDFAMRPHDGLDHLIGCWWRDGESPGGGWLRRELAGVLGEDVYWALKQVAWMEVYADQGCLGPIVATLQASRAAGLASLSLKPGERLCAEVGRWPVTDEGDCVPVPCRVCFRGGPDGKRVWENVCH